MKKDKKAAPAKTCSWKADGSFLGDDQGGSLDSADKRFRVAVILGGNSMEREVSIRSGQAVAYALDPARFHVLVFDPVVDLPRMIKEAPRLDAALIMLHGRGGEDGSMQGMLDLLGVPYQCSGVLGCALAMDKVMSKDRFRQKGLPVAPDLVLERGQAHAQEQVMGELGLPVVVKPAREGSSFGISIIKKRKQLKKALEMAFELDRTILVERYLQGREITSSVIGNLELTALPLIEIIPDEKYDFFDYTAKYVAGASQEVCPADLDPATTSLIQDLGVKAHQALGLMGYSRSDFILTDDGPFILESNTIPGMTATSLFPQAAAAAGMSFEAMTARLVHLAMERREL
jgi:D-alanine-D-alanine ligase